MRPDSPPLVVAIGGNAISPDDAPDDISAQFERMMQTCRYLADVIAAGRSLIITHGNGPQVGAALRRVELAAREVYRLPLHICVADVQGGMGYMITQALGNELRRRGLPQRVGAIVTSVRIDADDPALHTPSKPIGEHYDAARAEQLSRTCGWQMREEPGHGWRRIVPSPRPREIIEIDLIRRLVEAGQVIVCGGGGGVPVVADERGQLRGVEAVIDKDLTAALLARAVNAETLVLATAVDRVYLHFGTERQKALDTLTAAEAARLLDAGEFPPGSMGPKIAAALDFLSGAGRPTPQAVICELGQLGAALAGRAGTRITR